MKELTNNDVNVTCNEDGKILFEIEGVKYETVVFTIVADCEGEPGACTWDEFDTIIN